MERELNNRIARLTRHLPNTANKVIETIDILDGPWLYSMPPGVPVSIKYTDGTINTPYWCAKKLTDYYRNSNIDIPECLEEYI